jgi:Rap1a immunity proteins
MIWRTLTARGGLTLLVVGLRGVLRAEAFETGRELGRACAEGSSVEQMLEQTRCFGYIQGFLDAYRLSMAVMAQQAPRAQQPFCLPPGGHRWDK